MNLRIDTFENFIMRKHVIAHAPGTVYCYNAFIHDEDANGVKVLDDANIMVQEQIITNGKQTSLGKQVKIAWHDDLYNDERCYSLEAFLNKVNDVCEKTLTQHAQKLRLVFNTNGTIQMAPMEQKHYLVTFTPTFMSLINVKLNNVSKATWSTFDKENASRIDFALTSKCMPACNDFQNIDISVEAKNYGNISTLLYEINQAIYARAPHAENFVGFSIHKETQRVHWQSLMKDVKFTACATINRMLGFRENETLVTSSKIAPYVYNLQFTLPSIWIYSNIVAPVLVGDSLCKLLRIVGVENNVGAVTKIYEKPHYVPLAINTINQIDMMCYTSYGIEPIYLKDDTCMKLHFKKKRVLQLA